MLLANNDRNPPVIRDPCVETLACLAKVQHEIALTLKTTQNTRSAVPLFSFSVLWLSKGVKSFALIEPLRDKNSSSWLE